MPTTEHAAAQSLSHAVQFYRDVDFLLEAVASYLREGLLEGGAVIALARPERLRALEARLSMEADTRLFTMETEVAIARYLRGYTVDNEAFRQLVSELVTRARGDHADRPIRVYGEMVEVLWESGRTDAVVRVEQLWNEACRAHKLQRLCAYALTGFTTAEHAHVFDHICRAHSHVAPSERYSGLDADNLLREVAHMEQRANALEAEIARRRAAEAAATRLLATCKMLHRAETLEQVLEATLDGVTQLMGFQRGAVLLVNRDGSSRVEASRGLSEELLRAIAALVPSPAGAVEPEPIVISDIERHAEWAAFREPCRRNNIRSVLLVPLVQQHRSLGALGLYGEAPRELAPSELELARSIAIQVAQAIALRTYT